ncbi:MAG: hypothetical protein ABI678_01975 [Kofleriaceae bacterium]
MTNDVDYLNAKAMKVFDAPNSSQPFSVDLTFNFQYVGPFLPYPHGGSHALFARALPPNPGSCGAHQSTVMDCGPNNDTLLYAPIVDYLLDE